MTCLCVPAAVKPPGNTLPVNHVRENSTACTTVSHRYCTKTSTDGTQPRTRPANGVSFQCLPVLCIEPLNPPQPPVEELSRTCIFRQYRLQQRDAGAAWSLAPPRQCSRDRQVQISATGRLNFRCAVVAVGDQAFLDGAAVQLHFALRCQLPDTAATAPLQVIRQKITMTSIGRGQQQATRHISGARWARSASRRLRGGCPSRMIESRGAGDSAKTSAVGAALARRAHGFLNQMALVTAV